MYLTRNETERCVMARIVRQKQLHQQNFTLRQYGTWPKAEAAAKRWVKAKLLELPPPIPAKGRLTSRNTSGVVGVRLAWSVRRRGEKEYGDWRWIASWPGCPLAGGIGWSVNRYGDQLAFISACVARELETVDREQIEAEVARRKKGAGWRKLLARKLIEPS